MTPDAMKRMGAILVLFVVLLVVILVTQPKKESKATKPAKPAATESAELPTVGSTPPVSTPASPTTPAPAGGTQVATRPNVPPPLAPELLSGPPRKDIFVVTPVKTAGKRTSKASNATSTRTQGALPNLVGPRTPNLRPGQPVAPTPPPLKLLGTVLLHGDGAAALLEIGTEKVYVETGETIPYGASTLTVAQVVPEEVEVLLSGGSRLLRIAEL